MAKKKEIPLLVTTSHRGVFFGYATERPKPGTKSLWLTRVRNCVYWSADARGFIGLGTTGPTVSCKIGPAIPEHMLNDITAIGVCTDEAAKAWELAPWR